MRREITPIDCDVEPGPLGPSGDASILAAMRQTAFEAAQLQQQSFAPLPTARPVLLRLCASSHAVRWCCSLHVHVGDRVASSTVVVDGQGGSMQTEGECSDHPSSLGRAELI